MVRLERIAEKKTYVIQIDHSEDSISLISPAKVDKTEQVIFVWINAKPAELD